MPDAAAGGVLPAMELVEIGRPDPLARMRAARAVFGRNVRAFHVEALDGVAFRKRLAGRRQIAQARGHGVGRSGDHGGVEARDAGGELRAQRARDLFVRGRRVVVVDAGEAIDLQIDEAGREPQVAGVVARLHRENRCDRT